MKADIVIVGGAGHIGLPLGILFANKGKKVILYDKNKKHQYDHFHFLDNSILQ